MEAWADLWRATSYVPQGCQEYCCPCWHLYERIHHRWLPCKCMWKWLCLINEACYFSVLYGSLALTSIRGTHYHKTLMCNMILSLSLSHSLSLSLSLFQAVSSDETTQHAFDIVCFPCQCTITYYFVILSVCVYVASETLSWHWQGLTGARQKANS